MGAVWLMIVVMVLLKVQMQRGQPDLNFNYASFSNDQPGLNRLRYLGDAGRRSSEIRLTGVGSAVYSRYRYGRVWSVDPLRLWDRAQRRQAIFQTQISFLLSSARGQNPSDGLAFFIEPLNSRIPYGSINGNMGIYDPSGRPTITPLFAVEFDFFSNSWDPPNGGRHVGININSRNSTVWRQWGVGDGYETNATITYDPLERLISVRSRSRAFSYQPRIDYHIDLKTLLPEWVHVGISASTSGSDGAINHNLLSWSFTSILVSDPPIN